MAKRASSTATKASKPQVDKHPTVRVINLIDSSSSLSFEGDSGNGDAPEDDFDAEYTLRCNVSYPKPIRGRSYYFLCDFGASRRPEADGPIVQIEATYGIVSEGLPEDKERALFLAKEIAGSVVWQRFSDLVAHMGNQMRMLFPPMPHSRPPESMEVLVLEDGENAS